MMIVINIIITVFCISTEQYRIKDLLQRCLVPPNPSLQPIIIKRMMIVISTEQYEIEDLFNK